MTVLKVSASYIKSSLIPGFKIFTPDARFVCKRLVSDARIKSLKRHTKIKATVVYRYSKLMINR